MLRRKLQIRVQGTIAFLLIGSVLPDCITHAAFDGGPHASVYSGRGGGATWDGPDFDSTQTPDAEEPLKLGVITERAIKSNESHRFSIDLQEKQLLQVNVKEKGIDVRVGISLNDKDDKRVMTEVNFGTGYSRERCTLIVEQSGKYTVYVWASKFLEAGRYQLVANLKGEAVEVDRKDLEAQKLLVDGFKSWRTGSKEGLEETVQKWQEAQSKWIEIGDAYWAGFMGNLLGVITNQLGKPKKAFAFYTQALSLMKTADDAGGEAQIRANMAQLYSSSGNKPQALNYYKQSLALEEQIGNPFRSVTLINIGNVMIDLGHPDEAVKSFEKALPLLDQTQDEFGKGTLFNGMGRALESMGNIQEALNYYRDKALPIFQGMRPTSGTLRGQATAFTNIGAVFYTLGDRKTALENFTLALRLFEKIGDPRGMAACYRNVASVYADRKQYADALDHLKNKALPLWIEVDDSAAEAITLDAIGSVYLDQKRTQEALDYFRNKAMPMWLRTEDRDGQALTLNNIADAFGRSGDRPTARKFLNDALSLYITAGNQLGQSLTLSNLMAVWAVDNPNLAVLYGKLSLKGRQQQRKYVRKVDPELQKSFVREIQNSYQSLTELLIRQNDLDSAVRVLDLYRAQQYFDFDPSEASIVESIKLSKREQRFLDLYTTFSEESTKITLQIDELRRDLADHDATESEKNQLQSLKNGLQTRVDKFLSNVREAESQFNKPDPEASRTTNTTVFSEFLGANPNAVVIYTLIGTEQFYLIMIDKDGIQPVSVPINGKLLNDKAKEFATIIKNVDSVTRKPNIDVTDQAKELYKIVFGPIEKRLPKNTSTILWNLDGNLRYVPINALHDGNDYLVRRRLNNVLMTRTELKTATEPSEIKMQATGFAVTREIKQVKNLTLPHNFPALIGSMLEVNYVFSGNGKNAIFEGKPLVDSAFTKDAMLRELRKEMPVVHISSHFEIQPGDLSLSFLVLGDGNAFSLLDMKKEAESFPSKKLFAKVDLLTLSACDTGISEPDADGSEVDSFAELAQRFGAASVLATLWSVNECSTAEFVRRFYENKFKRNMNKAEGIRQAQLALLDGAAKSSSSCEAHKGQMKIDSNSATTTAKTYKVYKENFAKPFAHPYYWSPFILYGSWK